MPNTVSLFMGSSSSLNNFQQLLPRNHIAYEGIRQHFTYNGLFTRDAGVAQKK